ncbi:MAG: thiamine-phosphate kinase [Acidimicrobiia bacterium]
MFLERLARALPPPPPGEVWLGDDAAVLTGGLLFATDVLAEGVHFDLSFSTLFDAGWKALAVNCSDLAAMGGVPRAAVAAVVVPGDRPGVADGLAAGVVEAADALDCPLVGGDTAVGPVLVVTVAVLGDAPPSGAVLRSGARPEDTVFVTGSLGGPRAALAALRRGSQPLEESVVRLHRPVPRLAEGQAAAAAGARAMIDLSDGLSSDLRHICRASGVGVVLEAAAVPVGAGASLEDALAGGDDYELCFTAPDPDRVAEAFGAAGLAAPVRIGTVTDDGEIALQEGDGRVRPLPPAGFEHPVP